MVWFIFDRMWFITGTSATGMLGGTIWLSKVYQLFGADIGPHAFFQDTFVRVPFMISLKDRVTIETGATLETVCFLFDGSILFDTITLESDVVIGSHCFIGLGSHVEKSVLMQNN